MKQDRLNGPATIPIKRELTQSIKIEDAVKTFAAMKARHVCFWKVSFICSLVIRTVIEKIWRICAVNSFNDIYGTKKTQ